MKDGKTILREVLKVQSKPKNTYHDNFIEGVKRLIGSEKLDSVKKAASFLGIKHMTLYKVMDRTNKPTVEHCIILCDKAGYSANWLFLNRGEALIDTEVTMDKMMKEIKALRGEVFSIRNS